MLDNHINLTDHSLHFRQFPPFQLLPSVRFDLTTLGLPDQSLIRYATAAFTQKSTYKTNILEKRQYIY